MTRAASLLLAAMLCLALLLLPAMRGRELTAAGHGLLTPLLVLVCALFVHGVGIAPRHGWAKRLLSPWLLWPSATALAAWWWLAS